MLHDALGITDGPVLVRWPKVLPQRSPEEVGAGLRGRKVREGRDDELRDFDPASMKVLA